MSAEPPRDPPVQGPSQRRIRKKRAERRRPPSPDISSSLDISAYLEDKYQEELAQAANAPAQPPPRRIVDEGISSPRMRMFEEFQRRMEGSADWMQKWYFDNYEKVDHYNQLRFDILYILGEHLPGIREFEDLNPSQITGMLKSFITELITKFNRFNIDLHQIQGHEIAGLIKDHHRKKKIEDLERATAFYAGYQDAVTQQLFLDDLQARVISAEHFNSSMQEELQIERQENVELQSQLADYAREAVVREEECMQNVLNLSKRANLNSMLLEEIAVMVEKSGVMDPNVQDCQEVVEKWASRVNQTINENAGEIGELLQKVDAQNKQITDLEGTLERQRNEIADLQDEVRRLREVAGVHGEENILDRSPRSFTPPAVLSKSDPGIIRTPNPIGRWEWYNAFNDTGDNSAISHLDIPAGTAKRYEIGPPMLSPPTDPILFRKWQVLFGDMERPTLGSLPSTPVMPREEILPRMGEYTYPGATRPGEVDKPNVFYVKGMSELDPSVRDSDPYNALYNFIKKYESPEVDFDASLESFVFERGAVPTALRIRNNLETGFRDISLVEDRGYYPGFLPPGAETWDEAQGDIRQGRSPPPAHQFSGKRYPNRVIWPDTRNLFLQLLRSPRGTEVIGRPLLGTHVVPPPGRAPQETVVIQRAPLGTQVIGRAPLGTQVIGRAPLGTQVIGRAPLGTQVIGRAPLGTQVIGRAPLGTQV
ncbi:uncharacterized protein TNIN_378831, partial [Trichonephila inaurata madagascariensis]